MRSAAGGGTAGQIGGAGAQRVRLVRVQFLAPELDGLVQRGQQEDAQRGENEGLQRFDVPPGEYDAFAVAAVELCECGDVGVLTVRLRSVAAASPQSSTTYDHAH